MTILLNLLMAVKWPWKSASNEATEATETPEIVDSKGTIQLADNSDVMTMDTVSRGDIGTTSDQSITPVLEGLVSQNGGTTTISDIAQISIIPIRLVLLHHWTFSTGTGGDFESRMKRLKVRVRTTGSSTHREGDLVEKAPFHEANSYLSNDAIAEPMLLANSMVRDVTANSYLKTEMIEANGESVECLYRGPFTALPEFHQIKKKPYGNSDEARAIIKEIGMEEISHASAFELGRLLAFNDHNFVKTAARWRQTNYITKLAAANVAEINTLFPHDKWAGGVDALMYTNKMSDALLNMSLKCLSNPPSGLVGQHLTEILLTASEQTADLPAGLPPSGNPSQTGTTLQSSGIALRNMSSESFDDFVGGPSTSTGRYPDSRPNGGDIPT